MLLYKYYSLNNWCFFYFLQEGKFLKRIGCFRAHNYCTLLAVYKNCRVSLSIVVGICFKKHFPKLKILFGNLFMDYCFQETKFRNILIKNNNICNLFFHQSKILSVQHKFLLINEALFEN